MWPRTEPPTQTLILVPHAGTWLKRMVTISSLYSSHLHALNLTGSQKEPQHLFLPFLMSIHSAFFISTWGPPVITSERTSRYGKVNPTSVKSFDISWLFFKLWDVFLQKKCCTDHDASPAGSPGCGRDYRPFDRFGYVLQCFIYTFLTDIFFIIKHIFSIKQKILLGSWFSIKLTGMPPMWETQENWLQMFPQKPCLNSSIPKRISAQQSSPIRGI